MAIKLVLMWILYRTLIVNADSNKWKCHNYHKDNREICTPVIYHYGNQPVKCMICDYYDGYTNNFTICKTVQFNVTITDIMNAVPIDTERLVIRYDNKWNGYLPLEPDPINLNVISRLTNLQYFHLTDVNYKYYQLYPIEINVTTLNNLQSMKSLVIRIPVVDNQKVKFGDIVQKLPQLELLDLSYTRGLGLDSVVHLFQNLNSTNIRHLCLRKHQLIGEYGYISDYAYVFKTFKHSFPNLIELDLSDNTIARIPPGISSLAPNLKKFDISGNMLLDSSNMALLFESFMHPSLTVLSAGYQGFKGRNPDPVIHTGGYLLAPQEESGEQHPHSIDDLKERQSKMLVRCMNFASGGNISNAIDKTVSTCKLIYCVLPSFFKEINCTTQTFLPVLSTVFNYNCMLYMNVPIGKSLEEFYFSEVHLEQAQTIGAKFSGTLCLNKDNNLKTLFADGNEIWMQSSQMGTTIMSMDGISGFDKLKYVSLSNNSVSTQENSTQKFMGMLPNVSVLDISGNSLNFTNFCAFVPSITSLNLQNTNLTKVSPDLVKNCSNLKTLQMGYNNIDVGRLNSLDLEGSQMLKHIDLQWCGIHILEKGFLDTVDDFDNLTIDISNNPIHCNCTQKSQAFARWIIASQNRIINYHKYYCSGPGGLIFLNNINPSIFWDQCDHYNLKTIIESVIITLSVISFLFLLCVLYRIRWRLKYWLFYLQQSCLFRCSRNRNNKKKLWKYDAFISYCAEDRFWVHETLMKTLENTYGFNLCIHYRDFPVGGDVAETIAERMSISREIIIVLSDVALKSEWCQFELDEALMQIYRRQQHLILIKLGKIKPHLLTSKVAHILDNHTFMEWSDRIEHHKLFWAKLVGELYNDQDGSCFCCCPYGARSLGYKDILDPVLDSNYTAEDEQTEEYVDMMTSYSKECWHIAQRSKQNAQRAKQYQQKLQKVLHDEELPQWAYGPIPRNIDQLIQNDQSLFEDQTYHHARERVKLMIQCLNKHYNNESDVYKTHMQKIKDDDGNGGQFDNILQTLDSDDD